MSYYTYFKPDQWYNNPSHKSVDELSKQLAKYKDLLDRERTLLHLQMVDSYYEEEINKVYQDVSVYFKSISACYDEMEKLNWAIRSAEELSHYGEVGINHADCYSEYELQEDIDTCKDSAKRILRDLLCLTRIKNKDEDYLKSEYANTIDDYLDQLAEVKEEQWYKQFMLDNFSTKEDESERYERENNEDGTTTQEES